MINSLQQMAVVSFNYDSAADNNLKMFSFYIAEYKALLFCLNNPQTFKASFKIEADNIQFFIYFFLFLREN